MFECCRDLQVSRKRMTKDLILINTICLAFTLILIILPRWHANIVHLDQAYIYFTGILFVRHYELLVLTFLNLFKLSQSVLAQLTIRQSLNLSPLTRLVLNRTKELIQLTHRAKMNCHYGHQVQKSIMVSFTGLY